MTTPDNLANNNPPAMQFAGLHGLAPFSVRNTPSMLSRNSSRSGLPGAQTPNSIAASVQAPNSIAASVQAPGGLAGNEEQE